MAGKLCLYAVTIWASWLQAMVMSFGVVAPTNTKLREAAGRMNCFGDRVVSLPLSSSTRLRTTHQSELEGATEIDEDSDDSDSDDGLKTYEDYKQRLESLSLATSVDPSCAPQAQALLENMLSNGNNNDDYDESLLRPRTDVYNLVMNCWSFSRDVAGVHRAEEILRNMENEESGSLASPDVESYMAVMDGHINRRDPTEAVAIFERLRTRHSTVSEDESAMSAERLRPNTSTYNRLIKAWRNSDREDSATRACLTFDDLMESYQQQLPPPLHLKPNAKTFTHLIATLTLRDKKRSYVKAQHLYDFMRQIDIEPDTRVCNALIKSYALSSRKNKYAKARAVFNDLRDRHGNFTDHDDDLQESLAPNEVTFIHMLKALSNPKEKNVPNKVNELLALMHNITSTSKKGALATPIDVYNQAFKTLAWANDPSKATHAYELLQILPLHHHPNRQTYNLILQACAFTSPDSTTKQQRMDACRIAIQTYNLISTPDGNNNNGVVTPDHVTYGLFLKVCANLMPQSSDKRPKVVQNLFRRCCHEGLVSDFVLEEFLRAAPPELVRQLIETDKEKEELQLSDIPLRWSRNVT